jgi:hypothetical protein
MTPIPMRVENGELPPDLEAMQKQAEAKAYFEALPFHKKFSLRTKAAMLVKAQRPLFRGRVPQGMGLRAQARSQGYSNQSHMAREWHRAQVEAGVIPA